MHPAKTDHTQTDGKPPVVEDGTRAVAKARPDGREAFLFSLRATVAGAMAFICYRWTQLPGLSWAPVSAVLMMEPALRPSLRLSLVHLVGNLTGALCGASGSVLLGPTLAGIALGLMATGMLCHYARLDDGRPTWPC